MSKSSRKLRARNNGTAPSQTTVIANAVATLPGAPHMTPALTLVDSASSTGAHSATVNDTSVQGRNPPLDIKIKIGEVTKEQIRQIFDWLHAQSDIQPGTLWHSLPGSLRSRFGEHSVTNLPYATSLMQELGLVRHWGRNVTTMWQIIDQSFFDEVVSDHWFERAVLNEAKEGELVNELRIAKVRIQELEQVQPTSSATSEAVEPDRALMVQVAGLLEDIEQLKARDTLQAGIIADLERKLAEPPKVTATHVAQYLAELRACKT